MNRWQWFIMGLGSMLFSIFMFKMALGFGLCDFGTLADVICNQRKYAYAIPAIIGNFLSWMFWICGVCEWNTKPSESKNE